VRQCALEHHLLLVEINTVDREKVK
jgi:hypothetical protein